MINHNIFDVCDEKVYREGADRIVTRLKWELERDTLRSPSMLALVNMCLSTKKSNYKKYLPRIKKLFLVNKYLELHNGIMYIERDTLKFAIIWDDIVYYPDRRLFGTRTLGIHMNCNSSTTRGVVPFAFDCWASNSRPEPVYFAPHSFSRFFSRNQGKTIRHLMYDVGLCRRGYKLAEECNIEFNGDNNQYIPTATGMWFSYNDNDGNIVFKTYIDKTLMRNDQRGDCEYIYEKGLELITAQKIEEEFQNVTVIRAPHAEKMYLEYYNISNNLLHA